MKFGDYETSKKLSAEDSYKIARDELALFIAKKAKRGEKRVSQILEIVDPCGVDGVR